MTTAETTTLGRSLVRWVVSTTILFFVLVGAAVLVVTDKPGNAAAIGAFSAVWGGPAFGSMFGAGTWAIRHDDLARDRGELGRNHAPVA